MVCDNRSVRDLNMRLSEVFEKLLQVAKSVQQEKTDQRKWLRSTRDKCEDKECLLNVYIKRLRVVSGRFLDASPVDETPMSKEEAQQVCTFERKYETSVRMFDM